MRIHGVHFLAVAAVALSACGTDADTSATDPNTTDPVGTTVAGGSIGTVIAHRSSEGDVAGGGGCG